MFRDMSDYSLISVSVSDFAQYNIPYKQQLVLDLPLNLSEMCTILDNTRPQNGGVYVNQSDGTILNAFDFERTTKNCYSTDLTWFFYSNFSFSPNTPVTTVKFDFGDGFVKYKVDVFDPGRISLSVCLRLHQGTIAIFCFY